MFKTITNILKICNVDNSTDNTDSFYNICEYFCHEYENKNLELVLLDILFGMPQYFDDIVSILKNFTHQNLNDAIESAFINLEKHTPKFDIYRHIKLSFDNKTKLFTIINKYNKLTNKIILQVHADKFVDDNSKLLICIFWCDTFLYMDLCKHLKMFNLEYDIKNDILNNSNTDDFITKNMMRHRCDPNILNILNDLNILNENHIMCYFDNELTNLGDLVLCAFESGKYGHNPDNSFIVSYIKLMKQYFNKDMKNEMNTIFYKVIHKYLFKYDYDSFIKSKTNNMKYHDIDVIKNKCEKCNKIAILSLVHCLNICDACLRDHINNSSKLICYHCNVSMVEYLRDQYRYREFAYLESSSFITNILHL